MEVQRKETVGVDPDILMSNAWHVWHLNDSLINVNSTAAECYMNNLKVTCITDIYHSFTDEQEGYNWE